MDVEVCLMEPHKKVEVPEARMKRKKHVQVEGPDGRLAWGIAFAACLINFIMAGLGRVSGVLYVALIEMFGVSRRTATAPFAIRSSTRNLLGPVVGILGQQYGVRTISVIGGFLGAITSAACFFAYDMNWITVLWGGLNGVATALTTTLAQVIINQYFEKHRTTASGLAFSGGCVSALIFPALIEYLLHNYGLQGTFLILSGIIMNVIPAAMLLRKPPWLKNKRSNASTTANDENIIKGSKTAVNGGNNDAFCMTSEEEKLSDVRELDSCGATVNQNYFKQSFSWFNNDANLVADITTSLMQCSFDDVSNVKLSIKLPTSIESTTELKALILYWLVDMYNVVLSHLHGVHSTLSIAKQKFSYSDSEISSIKQSFFQLMDTLDDGVALEYCVRQAQSQVITCTGDTIKEILLELCDVYKQYSRVKQEVQLEVNGCLSTAEDCSSDKLEKKAGILQLASNLCKDFMEHIKTAIRFNKNPIFVLVCICRTVHIFTLVPVMTVMVDFGIDNGLSEEDGKFIIGALSLGDLAGRLGLGWVTDRGYISLPRYMLVVMVLQGASTVALPFMTDKITLSIMFAVFGIFQGSLFVRHPVIVYEYMGNEGRTIAMGSINFMSGVLGFAMPYYIGYFRDTLGSYNNMFYVTGLIGISIGLIWIFEPQFARCGFRQSGQAEKENNSPTPV